jgi:hypothetical protein
VARFANPIELNATAFVACFLGMLLVASRSEHRFRARHARDLANHYATNEPIVQPGIS